MKQFFLFVTIIFSVAACAAEKEIPQGSWTYDIIVNDTNLGSSTTTTTFENGQWNSMTVMEMNAGGVKNHVTIRVIEKADYTPLSVKSVTTVTQGDNRQEMKTTALVKGKTIELDQDGVKKTITLGEFFVLDGTFLNNELLKKRFKTGTSITYRVYDPSLEPGESIPVRVTVMGKKEIMVRGKKIVLNHVVQKIENLKSFDYYLDDNAVVYMVSMSMLNNNIVMILRDLR